MSDDASAHDNDADSRPRIHLSAQSKRGSVEVCVHGGEGERAEDIAPIADARLDKLLEGQGNLRDRDDDADGGEFQ